MRAMDSMTPLLQPVAAAAARATKEEASASSHGGGSRELEAILSDASVPWARRAWRGAGVELPLLLRVALPAVAVYMINYVMSMSTQIFCGQLGNLELAAASLGNTGVQVFSYGLMVRTYATAARVCASLFLHQFVRALLLLYCGLSPVLSSPAVAV
jgi:multidrug resistance protein, MATE family